MVPTPTRAAGKEAATAAPSQIAGTGKSPAMATRAGAVYTRRRTDAHAGGADGRLPVNQHLARSGGSARPAGTGMEPPAPRAPAPLQGSDNPNHNALASLQQEMEGAREDLAQPAAADNSSPLGCDLLAAHGAREATIVVLERPSSNPAIGSTPILSAASPPAMEARPGGEGQAQPPRGLTPETLEAIYHRAVIQAFNKGRVRGAQSQSGAKTGSGSKRAAEEEEVHSSALRSHHSGRTQRRHNPRDQDEQAMRGHNPRHQDEQAVRGHNPRNQDEQAMRGLNPRDQDLSLIHISEPTRRS